MKLVSLVLISIFAVSAQAETVFRCESGSRFFSIEKYESGAMRGTFKDFSGLPQSFNCTRVGRGYQFRCASKDGYMTRVRRDTAGQVVVDFELAGDFYPDSGYLFQLNCQNIRRTY